MSDNDAMSKQVFVNDGDTIIVVARTQQVGPTVSDPCDASPYLSQAYRIVSDRFGSTLALVPLGTRAVRVSQNEIDRFVSRKKKELEEKWGCVVDVASILADFGKVSGWKFGAPVVVDAEPFDPCDHIPGSPR